MCIRDRSQEDEERRRGEEEEEEEKSSDKNLTTLTGQVGKNVSPIKCTLFLLTLLKADPQHSTNQIHPGQWFSGFFPNV